MLGRTADELAASITAPELAEWAAFEAEYGLPDVFTLTGEVCCTLARFLGTGGTKWHPADFVPYFDAQRPKQTTRDHEAMFRAAAARGRVE